MAIIAGRSWRRPISLRVLTSHGRGSALLQNGGTGHDHAESHRVTSSSSSDAAPTHRLSRTVHEAAMERQVALHRTRVETMYNRHRALFAESLVAELLGATEEPDPSSAWDVLWQPDGTPIKIQVKCSGGCLPRNVDPDRVAPAKWVIETPKKGWDPKGASDRLWNLDAGHHCDVFVLARHQGRDLAEGWSFAVAPRALVEQDRSIKTGKLSVTPKRLEGWSVKLVEPDELAKTVLAAATAAESIDGSPA